MSFNPKLVQIVSDHYYEKVWYHNPCQYYEISDCFEWLRVRFENNIEHDVISNKNLELGLLACPVFTPTTQYGIVPGWFSGFEAWKSVEAYLSMYPRRKVIIFQCGLIDKDGHCTLLIVKRVGHQYDFEHWDPNGKDEHLTHTVVNILNLCRIKPPLIQINPTCDNNVGHCTAITLQQAIIMLTNSHLGYVIKPEPKCCTCKNCIITINDNKYL